MLVGNIQHAECNEVKDRMSSLEGKQVMVKGDSIKKKHNLNRRKLFGVAWQNSSAK